MNSLVKINFETSVDGNVSWDMEGELNLIEAGILTLTEQLAERMEIELPELLRRFTLTTKMKEILGNKYSD